MCEHSYWYEGFKQYGADLPGYAMNAYFPGDEPGMRCKLGEYCCEDDCPNGADFWLEHGEVDAPESDVPSLEERIEDALSRRC